MKALALLVLTALVLPAQNYRVAGVVVNAQSGRPLNHVRVSLTSSNERTATSYLTTGPDGRFTFAGLRAGKWSISAQRAGFPDVHYGQGPSLASPGVAVITGPGAPSEALVFRMYPGAFITGKVRDVAGDPVENALVGAWRSGVLLGKKRMRSIGACWTFDDGSYAIGPLPQGTYYLGVTAEPWYAREAGRPGAAVSYAEHFYPGTADPGKAAPLVVRAGEDVQADITLTPERAVTVRLKVDRNGLKPAMLVREGPQGVWMPRTMEQHALELRLTRGRYTLWLANPGDQVPLPQTIEAGALDMEIELRPDPPATVSATFELVGMAPSATPGLGVALVHDEQEFGVPRMIPAAGGKVEFPGVPAGRYQLRLFGTRVRSCYLESVVAEGGSFQGGRLEVAAGTKAQLRVRINGEGGSVHGFAYRQGQPVAGVTAVLLPMDDPGIDPPEGRIFQTDSDGSFEYPTVRPGEYVLFALDNAEDLEYTNREAIEPYLATGQRITVKPKETLKLRLDLPDPNPPAK